MVMDYNKIIQNEIDEAYNNGKSDGYQIACRIVFRMHEEFRNSMNTTEIELKVFDVLENILTNSKV